MNTPPLRTLTEENIILAALGALGFCVSGIYCLYHVFNILQLTVSDDHQKEVLNISTLKRNFNFNLALFGVSVLGLYITFIIQALDPFHETTPWILQVCNDFLIATCEYAYVNYSSSRGSKIIVHVYPHLKLFLSRLNKSIPFLVYAPIIPAIINAFNFTQPHFIPPNIFPAVEKCLSAIAAIAVLVFDSIFLSGFIKFVSTIQENLKENTDPSFLIIARHGRIACAAVIAATGFYGFACAFEDYSFNYNIMVFMGYNCLSAVLIAITLMKVRMARQLQQSRCTTEGVKPTVIDVTHNGLKNAVRLSEER
ncbi:hypothetical protein BDR26DRAFT_867698 [Obelidium mucronatum]|nr:hypothetical protein BDR26DRAFT_867698 [Obelidium mucronatum]